jgi:hypothetical protein
MQQRHGSGDAGRLGLPPWPEALEFLAELNRALRMLADEHKALVAEVYARFLGHGLTIGNPAQQATRRPRERGRWYCDLIEPNGWGASEIRGAFWVTLSGRTASKLTSWRARPGLRPNSSSPVASYRPGGRDHPVEGLAGG